MKTIKVKYRYHGFMKVAKPQLKVVNGKLRTINGDAVNLIDFPDDTEVYVVRADVFKKFKLGHDMNYLR